MNRTIALSILLAAAPCLALAGTIEGKVIEVPDGVTIRLLASEGASTHRVRIAGIDAPPKERTLAGRSRESLRRMAAGRKVRVETTMIDSRGMLLGNVLIERSAKDCADQPCAPLVDPGLSQLSKGLAKVDEAILARQSRELQKLYKVAEDHARSHRLGLWREGSIQQVAHTPP